MEIDGNRRTCKNYFKIDIEGTLYKEFVFGEKNEHLPEDWEEIILGDYKTYATIRSFYNLKAKKTENDV